MQGGRQQQEGGNEREWGTGQERNEKKASPWTREKSIFTIIEVYDETFSYHFASPHKC